MDAPSRIRGLYFVTAECPELGRTHEGLALQAAAGGARVVQYREKGRGPRYAEAARAVRDACAAFDVTFVVNDDPDLALELSADGLHLGQSDLHRLPKSPLPKTMLLGISVSSVDEAREAVAIGADHLGVGPIFATPTKTDAGPAIGLEGLRSIREAVAVPLAAIGGLDQGNAAEAFAAGADAVCVVSAISNAEDPKEAAARLAEVAAAAARTRGGGAA